MKVNSIKKNLKDKILHSLFSIEGVISVTLVGSFIDRDGLIGISDVDTIVIVDSLDEKLFKKCIQAVNKINPDECGLKGFQLKINNSFGPLKFDDASTVVIHLMVYDISGHQRHVIASPFTCLDWERSETYLGKSLKSIFPVGVLQPRDFLEGRRGLQNYLEDLHQGIISIRNYKFLHGLPTEVINIYPLDQRHKGEYAYHIIRNLLLNLFKLNSKSNSKISDHILVKQMSKIGMSLCTIHEERFIELSLLKNNRSKSYPDWVMGWISEFLEDFQFAFTRFWDQAETIYFMRHAETDSNDGSYLGQGRDPSILNQKLAPLEFKPQITYSSPAKRCLETIKRNQLNQPVVIEDQLKEINYGSAEGLTYKGLAENYPEIVKAWEKGEDPKFPDGENTEDVLNRLQFFINGLKPKRNSVSLVMTHNVVLRCLIGKSHSIPFKNWYRLSIPYAEPLEFKWIHGELYPNIPRNILQNIFYKL